jgi:ElaB/YqjD/DUF883 family membrane-anchored ribosome-binding protein
MATAAFDRFACETPGIRDVAKDTVRNVTHLAHEARAFKTMAVDAVEGRVVDAATRIRKEPFKFVGLAFAVGVPVGLAFGWMLNSCATPERSQKEKG